MKKKRKKHILIPKGPRTLDIDILFYGTIRLTSPSLTLPHPFWKQRLFVLLPLSKLTPSIKIKEKRITKSYRLSTLIENFQNIEEEKLALHPSPFYRRIKELIAAKESHYV